MIELVWGSLFTKSYRKRIAKDPVLREQFWDALETFTEDPFAPWLKTHQLTGRLKGRWAFSVSADCRIIFTFLSPTEVYLGDVGSHEEIY